LLKLGRRGEAGQFLGDALGYYRTAGMRPSLASALGLAGELHEANGSADEAAQARTEAAAITANLTRQHPIQAEA
jgi:hypothetical protein